MTIDECFEYYEETGIVDYQIYEHTDGEWYLMELDYNGNYTIVNVDSPTEQLSDELLTELENSDQWSTR